jgi:dolichyl-diphosphooligosaccharide--protein glycosyltransferase
MPRAAYTLLFPRGNFFRRPVSGAPGDGPAAALCFCLTFILAAGARWLELPFWDNDLFRLGDEYLLATHDAYHWIAGAEGFEFGGGHPMSEAARLLAGLIGVSPARAGFYLPALMSALTALGIFLWCAGMGSPRAGLCAGVLTSLTPGFCARTMLGFYDTDLVILLFAVMLGLVPAAGLAPYLKSPLEALCPPLAAEVESAGCGPDRNSGTLLTAPTLALFALSGLGGYMMQEWHSIFPYLTRFFVIMPPCVALALGPGGGRKPLLAGSLCHALPLLIGPPGFFFAALCAAALICAGRNGDTRAERFGRKAGAFLMDWRVLFVLWALLCAGAADTAVLQNMAGSFIAYTRRGGDISPLSPAGGPLVFPSVSQSIIEVQTVGIREMLLYVYPFELPVLIGAGLFLLRVLTVPAVLWLAPLFVLHLLSLRMGARMTIFGAPVIMISLCMEAGRLADYAAGALARRRASGAGVAGLKNTDVRRTGAPDADSRQPGASGSAVAGSGKTGPLRTIPCLLCTLIFAWPLVRHIPDYSQGPVLSREQAEGLSFLRTHSPEDAMVWNWWDWGYATHHFARRRCIADGARHGGPSLYLPAAVYTTEDPRFARQIIKYTALKGDVPGNVFAGLSAAGAQELMRELGDRRKPLIRAPGTQYLVVGFDLLHLGLWITRYGSWNFESKTAHGALMNNLAPALEYNVDRGVVVAEESGPIYASTMTVFEGKKVERFDFRRYGAYHFIFNVREATGATEGPRPLRNPPVRSGQGEDTFPRRESGEDSVLRDFWRRMRGPGIFSGPAGDKLVMDDVFYNTMMVQLLVRPPDDPLIAPYFRVVFDNVYTKIYEVI